MLQILFWGEVCHCFLGGSRKRRSEAFQFMAVWVGSFLSREARGMKDGEWAEKGEAARFLSRGARGMKGWSHALEHSPAQFSLAWGEGNESGRALESGTKSMSFPLAWDEGNESKRRKHGRIQTLEFPLAWGEGNERHGCARTVFSSSVSSRLGRGE